MKPYREIESTTTRSHNGLTAGKTCYQEHLQLQKGHRLNLMTTVAIPSRMCYTTIQMKIDPDRVPEGYEVATDMFGSPYLQRKLSPRQSRVADAIGLVLFAIFAVLSAFYFLG